VFDALQDRLEGIFSKVRGRGKLTERDIDEVSREIRLALLEADVNVRVVKAFPYGLAAASSTPWPSFRRR
jgi:signal recognition particle subunit SRP54